METFISNEEKTKLMNAFKTIEEIVYKIQVKEVRVGWDSAFKEMHENGDDKLLIPDVFSDEELR